MDLALNNGISMPALGFGVYRIPEAQTSDAVSEALRVGYRLVDTAAVYDNERAVGQAIRESNLQRDEVFIETKIWINDYGYDATLHAFEKSATKLGVETIDLLLLHQPLPADFEQTLNAYRALERLLADGRVRAIGVSNFTEEHLQALLDTTEIIPAVNQIELHPFFAQTQLGKLHEELGIVTQAWSPLGGVTKYGRNASTTFEDATLLDIAREVGSTPAQVMLAWHLQQGRAVIPKSTTPHRIAENYQAVNLRLSPEHLAAIDALDTGIRRGPNPEKVTYRTFGKEISEA